MGNIGSSTRRYDVLPLGPVTVETPTTPVRATDPSPGVPAPEPMPAPYPEPTPEPSPQPTPEPGPLLTPQAARSSRAVLHAG